MLYILAEKLNAIIKRCRSAEIKFMRLTKITIPTITLLLLFSISCSDLPRHHRTMLNLLKETSEKSFSAKNSFAPEAKLLHIDSVLNSLGMEHNITGEIPQYKHLKARILMELGDEPQAVKILEELVASSYLYEKEEAWKDLALAYFRLGERNNCISNHAAESCIMPVQGLGVHQDTVGSRNAIRIYEKLLKSNSRDYESRWLLNLAYMTLGEYPDQVPPEYLIPGMQGDTVVNVKPFMDIAAGLHLDVKNQAGGSITEDFNNDGYIDLITSSWDINENVHYFQNNADGTFSDLTTQANLIGITGGLNMVQADYNNDGYMDIFILRGAWKGKYGNEPNSLLKNNGDGTFTDVTTIAGLLSFHPTQTATWNDFNNDGWIDLFIGNETSETYNTHPCEFYINNGDGTFREIAREANCNITQYVKGVTSGDYDRDGWKDIFISTMNNRKFLLKNKGVKNSDVSFEDVTEKAGLGGVNSRTFPTWFWDYNNDGWMDIFVCDYTFGQSLAIDAGAEKLGVQTGSPNKTYLMHNNHDGTFVNKAQEMGLNKVVFAMGANFGDIDNDGFLDMYLGTGNPSYRSVVPNKMFKNLGGEKFADVTTSARVGHLQKGHSVSFADLDNDGDQDIYSEMGGAFTGDAYQSALFLNPNEELNNWITIQLQGTKSNRAAIGTLVKITCTENGVKRTIYREVNSGGSFGSSPLRREIGIGKATQIDELEIRWHGSGEVQTFKNVKPNQFIKITEGDNNITPVSIKKLTWILPDQLCLPLP